MPDWLHDLAGLDGPLRLAAALINFVAAVLARRRDRSRRDSGAVVASASRRRERQTGADAGAKAQAPDTQQRTSARDKTVDAPSDPLELA
ncbi:hypothetical protein [Actinomycetospora flava]|uniref:Uncharacterized protein n=1 Tax=Actinomycetospora flava TaxID=3129232 RepID=A0ABU8MDK9_9PSEU